MNTTMNTTNTIKVTKMNFAGLQLDVITGHPEYELLFVATQVAQAVGFKNPAVTLGNFFKALEADPVTYSQVHNLLTSPLTDVAGRKLSRNARFITEPQVYTLILRSHATQGEPFRKWVTEEVLPSIRKSGSYNVETSTTAEGIQFAAIFQSLPESSRQGAWKCS
ncbi:Bro-N domain-containing protein [Pectobacterium sp. CHL-2024]|uniref:BRO-N domain-containing protein n=1 Tax=Pectobacterium sp. CHL-2024 TaxID=3377079 RepID=UPI003815E910